MNHQSTSSEYGQSVSATSDTTSLLNHNANISQEDVLICGKCNFQCSDLELFIAHKSQCKGIPSSSSHSAVPENTQTSLVPSDQIAIHGTQNSLVSFPIGMSHVLLQSATGIPQLCRVVVDSGPSHLAGSFPDSVHVQPNTSPSSTLTTHDSIHEVELIKDAELSDNQSSIVTLTALDTWDKSYHDSSEGTRLRPEKDSLGLSSTDSEEEDVANFLANQMAVQKNTDTTQNSIQSVYEPCSLPQIMADSEEPLGTNQLQNDSQNLQDTRESKSKTRRPKKTTEKDLVFLQICKMESGVMCCTFDGCTFRTIHKKNIARHYTRHTDAKPFACDECSSRFRRRDKLLVHQRTHTGEKPFACEQPGCSYRAAERNCLIRHNRTHTDERPFQCQLCPYKGKDHSQLLVHLRSHTGDTPFHCQEENCTSAFATSSDLKRHHLIHTGLKKHVCLQCNYASTLKHNLTTHVRLNHFEGPKYACSVCAFVGVSRKQFKEHQRGHVTDKLGEGRSQKGGKKRSKGAAKFQYPHRFKCDVCGCGFVRDDSYRSHMRQHLNSPAVHKAATIQKLEPADASMFVEGSALKSYVITIDGISSTVYPFHKSTLANTFSL